MSKLIEKTSILAEWIFLIAAIVLLFKGEIELALIMQISSDLYEIKRKINNLER